MGNLRLKIRIKNIFCVPFYVKDDLFFMREDLLKDLSDNLFGV